MSVAFAPDYATSGLFYVCFVNRSGDVEIDEFKRSSASPTRADRSSRRRVIVIPIPGASTTPAARSSSAPAACCISGRATVAGSPAPSSETCSASCFASTRASPARTRTGCRANPYVDRGGRDEIFAYGFRNPWRFAFDGGRLAIGDVGQDTSRGDRLPPLRARRRREFRLAGVRGQPTPQPLAPGPGPGHLPGAHLRPQQRRLRGHGRLRGQGPRPALAVGPLSLRRLLPRPAAQLHPAGEPPAAVDDRALGVTRPYLTSFGEGAGGRIYLAQLAARSRS